MSGEQRAEFLLATRARERGETVLVVTVPVAVGLPVDEQASSRLSAVAAAGWRLVGTAVSGSYLVATFVRV